MKTHVWTYTFLFVFTLNANAQFPGMFKNDLEERNLKGPVVAVVSDYYDVKESFGEWEKGDLKLSLCSVFSEGGFLLLDTDGKLDEGGCEIKMYARDSMGRISSVERNYIGVPRSAFPNLLSYLPAAYDLDSRDVVQYEYNQDGSIKSETSKTVKFDENKESWQEGPVEEKKIYKYNDDGFDVWFYNSDGRRKESDIYRVIYSKRIIFESNKNGGINAKIFDEKGRLVSFAYQCRADNGELSSDVFYAYNNQGDLVCITSNAHLKKSIEGMDPAYPLVANALDMSNGSVFGYEYDSHNNWIVRKRYEKRGGEVIVTGWVERTIRYAGDGFDSKSYFQAFKEAEDEKVAALRARKEYDALPNFSLPSDKFGDWLRVLIKYPEKGTGLFSTLKKKNTWLNIWVKAPIDLFGKLGEASFEYDLHTDLGNYFSAAGERKDKLKSQPEIDQMIEVLKSAFKNPPVGKTGKKGNMLYARYLFVNGSLKWGMGTEYYQEHGKWRRRGESSLEEY